jgi:N-dimethylarginine dimethylaminohydrolase
MSCPHPPAAAREENTHHTFKEDIEIICNGGDVLYPVTYYKENLNTGSTSDNHEEKEDTMLPSLKKRGGKHLFVGITNRTNMAAAKYLKKVFSDVEVVPVDLLSGFTGDPMLLKMVVSHLDHETLIMPQGYLGDKLCELMGVEERGYKVIRVPSITACNVLSINGQLVLADANMSRESAQILIHEVMEKRGMVLLLVNESEFCKCEGGLTCRSILIP